MRFLREHMLLVTVIVATVMFVCSAQLGKRYDSLFQVADAFVQAMSNTVEQAEER